MKLKFIQILIIYSCLKASIGFNFVALIAGTIPDTTPTKTAANIDTTIVKILIGTSLLKI